MTASAPAFEAARAVGATLLLSGSTVEIDAPESIDERTLDAVAAIVARHKADVVAELRAEAATAALDGRAALDRLNRAEVRLPKLPGSPPVVAVPRSTWTPDVAEALDRLGYSHASVVLLTNRYPPGDPAMTVEAARLLKAGQYFEGTAAVSLAVRWCAPIWPERIASTSDLTRCGDCRHYRPDPLGAGGVGNCPIDGEGVAGLPLYPRALRRCSDFSEVDR